MSSPTDWPIKGYFIGYDPKTHQGRVLLDMVETQAGSEIKFENLTAEDIVVLTGILTRGGARYYKSGIVGIRS